ncbi:uncharacterized protein [Rutidosis leptorrhynchoides]|uniref:uncharacterized protein isoform X2 n=1 Tax=Rutidosis leptorrhynchoides TaxID=125765 RepID=UPI003A995A51
MKTFGVGTERNGFESAKIDQALGNKTLADKIENVGVKTPVVVEEPVKKKKVRIVKKIVKKKIIKKVPKRLLVVPNCNDLEKNVTANNDNTIMEIEETNKDGIDELKVKDSDQNRIELKDDDQKQIELKDSDENRIELKDDDQKVFELGDSDTKGIEVQDTDKKQIGSGYSDNKGVELKDSDHDQIEEEVSDQKWMELQDYNQNGIELQDSDQNESALQDMDRKSDEMEDSDGNRIEMCIRDEKRVEMLDSDQNRNDLPNSDQNQIELQDNDLQRNEPKDGDQIGISLKDSDEKQAEFLDSEHDNNTMDVEEHEGEEGVKDLVVNSQNEGLKSQEVESKKTEVSRETIVSWWRMKQRTKIFIHGLNKETVEDDIRKVFENFGEIVEVKMIRNLRSGKSRGFGFIRYALAEHANLALTRYRNIQICGSMCHTAAVEGYDTILLNYIDKKWNNENVLTLLQELDIKNIDEVTVAPDPQNTQLNGGFAFLEFETRRDAQLAYQKLQKKDIFGKNSKIKVSWAESLTDPVEEEMQNVKSVHAQNIPPSWGEKEVKDHFKMFGEIESIALAKNLHSAKRDDFAFINYKTHEAARSCIEASTCKKSTNQYGPQAQMKVSFSKTIPKGKSIKTISEAAVTTVPKVSQKPNQSRPYQSQYQNTIQSRPSQALLNVYKPQQPKNMNVPSIGRHNNVRGSSTTAELVQLLREQASWKLDQPSSTADMSTVHHQTSSRGAQLIPELGNNSLYHDPRYHQPLRHIPSAAQPRPIATSFPHYDPPRAHYISGSFNVVQANPRYLQTRHQPTYPGSNNIYR